MMRALAQLGVLAALKEKIAEGMPFLGICLGMQALFEWSEEAPELPGLGVFPGVVRRFPGMPAFLTWAGMNSKPAAPPRSFADSA